MTDETPIYGLDKDLDACDRIYFQLPESLRQEDRYLYGLKWFDYRFLHDVHATYLFAEAYRTAYRECFRQMIDHERAAHVKGVRSEDIFDGTQPRNYHLTGLYKGRQWADMLTMPYDAYCRIAFKWATQRSRRYLPRPTQLYSFDLLTAIQASWAEERAARLFLSTDERFKNAAYEGAKTQDDYHEWLMTQAALRANPVPYLARVLYDEEVLLESKVEARFGRATLENVRAYHS